jgi:DNA polymerase sigma
MESKVSQNSVFFHEKKIIGAKDQIDSILMLLREAVEDSRGRIFFETYMLDVIGSYSNGLALDYESSIDICIQFDDGLKKLRAL